MKVRLIDYGGEFCTSRKSPALPELHKLIEQAMGRSERIEFSLAGIKILTPSFIDELLPPLMLKYGREKIEQHVVFDPPLTGYLRQQIDRGLRLRQP